jgi:hypothetical protein
VATYVLIYSALEFVAGLSGILGGLVLFKLRDVLPLPPGLADLSDSCIPDQGSRLQLALLPV